MKFLFNIWLARVGLLTAFLLCIIYYLKAAHTMSPTPFVLFCRKANRLLRKLHKPLGVLLVIIGLMHGFLSSESVFSLSPGTLSWIVSVLLGVNWMIRKRLAKYKGWMYYHRILTLLFVLTLAYHIVDVGGFAPTLGRDISSRTELAGSDNPTGSISASGQQVYKDGVYTGEAAGYRPGIKVKVTVNEGKISKIEILSHNEKGERFYGPPIKTIPQEIIESQSTDVDVVTGATKTSKGIMQAVENALNGVASSRSSTANSAPKGSIPDRQMPESGGFSGESPDRSSRFRSRPPQQ